MLRFGRNTPVQIEISEEQRDLLMELVENALTEIRVEVRRTSTPAYHDSLVEKQAAIRTLLDELKKAA
jgi:hypothetical protein